MALFSWTKFRASQTPFCSAVIVAAGSATRMQGTDKIMAELGGEPVIRRTIRAFEENPFISEIVIVTREDLLTPIAQLCEDAAFTKTRAILLGGATRLESVRAGVDNLSQKAKLVAVHDGARPLVSQKLITEAVLGAARYGAAAPAIPVKDTVKRAQSGFVTQTPPRDELFAVQTPQTFDVDLLRAALQDAAEKNAAITDDCSAVERLGMRVYLTKGEERNLKITTPPDLKLAESFLQRIPGGEETMRIGHGYDVHRLTAGRKLILGGVEIPFEKGLDGHSDADVLVHAIMDALLGAAALGDIGKLFPDNDPAYAGISSLLLLEKVAQRLGESGFAVGNVDATVLAQRPKLAPYIPQMREKIAGTLGISADRVSVKATTEEGLGFTGSGEGIAAHAVCLLSEKEKT